jgi:hypothetical protein
MAVFVGQVGWRSLGGLIPKVAGVKTGQDKCGHDCAKEREGVRVKGPALFLAIGLLQGLDVDFSHLHHGLPDALCFLGIFVAQQFA